MLDTPRIFPPKKFYLVVWLLTGVLAVFGVIMSPASSIIFWVWLAIAVISVRQVWTTRWVQIDREGIRVRNIVQVGREIRWDAVSKIEEREIPVRKERSFNLIKVTGEMTSRPGRLTTITVDSDTVGFDELTRIVRAHVGNAGPGVANGR